MDKRDELIEELAAAAIIQLDGMGRGAKPAPRLQAAIEEAGRLLGVDLLAKYDRAVRMEQERERIRQELGL